MNKNKTLESQKSEQTEISTAFSRATIRITRRHIFKLRFPRNDVVSERFELRDRSVSGGVADDATFWILP
ncbi:hypothetical protein HanPI659440_Chr14g0552151 [Helianthus annuus]|nr:hypothetical protein HanPI659440_Chr14g0552151 [Helianthus annuus]